MEPQTSHLAKANVRANRYCLECHAPEHLGSSNARLDVEYCSNCHKLTNFGPNPGLLNNEIKKDILDKVEEK